MMRKISITFLFASILIFVSSCKKEESLQPNEEAASSQQAGIDFLNGGGEVDLGGTGGSGGGSTSIVEYFNATVNGIEIKSNAPFFQKNGSFGQINSSISSITNSFLLVYNDSLKTVNTTFSVGIPSLTFYKSATDSYTAYSGTFSIDAIDGTMVEGKFSAMMTNTQNTDTLTITNGQYRAAK